MQAAKEVEELRLQKENEVADAEKARLEKEAADAEKARLEKEASDIEAAKLAEAERTRL